MSGFERLRSGNDAPSSGMGWAPAVFILLWSGGFTALKAGLAYAEPITYLALRYGVVLAVLVRPESCVRSALFFLIPPIAAVIAWLLIGEAMPPLAWLGMALAAAGVAAANRPFPRARRLDSGGEEQR